MLSERIGHLRAALAEKLDSRTLTVADVTLALDILGSLKADAAAMEQHGGPIPRIVASTIDDAVIARAGSNVVRLRPRDVTPPAGDRA